VLGAGNSSTARFYKTYIEEPDQTQNYYRLKQTDFDGQTKKYETVVIDNSVNNTITLVRVVDLLGREVSDSYEGVKLLYYSDGTVVKSINY
jgi:hypothetical protein